MARRTREDLVARIEAFEAAREALDAVEEPLTHHDGRGGSYTDIPGPSHAAHEDYVRAKVALHEAELRLWSALPGTDCPGRGNAVAFGNWLYMAGPRERVTVASVGEDLDGTTDYIAREVIRHQEV